MTLDEFISKEMEKWNVTRGLQEDIEEAMRSVACATIEAVGVRQLKIPDNVLTVTEFGKGEEYGWNKVIEEFDRRAKEWMGEKQARSGETKVEGV